MQNVPIDLFKEIKDVKFVENLNTYYFDLNISISAYYDGNSTYYIERPFTDYREESKYIGNRYVTHQVPYTNYYDEANYQSVNGNVPQKLKRAFIYPYSFNCFKEMIELDKNNFEFKEIQSEELLSVTKKACDNICNSDAFIKQIKEVVNSKTLEWIKKNINEFSGSWGFDIVDYDGDVVIFPIITMSYIYKGSEYKSHIAYINSKVYRYHETFPQNNNLQIEYFQDDGIFQKIYLQYKKCENEIEQFKNHKKTIETQIEIEKEHKDEKTNELNDIKRGFFPFKKKDKNKEMCLQETILASDKNIQNMYEQIKELQQNIEQKEKELQKYQRDQENYYKERYKNEKEKNFLEFNENNTYIYNDKQTKRFINIDINSKKVQDYINELNSLVGLNKVKEEVKSLVNLINLNINREKKGLPITPMSYHLVFTGNPGTGKTTIARLLAKIYNALGIISSDNLVEVDRSGLVAGYVGQTAIKTTEVINKAMGGVLFIDEAYSLEKGENNDFGQEAIDTLLKAMEDYRDNLVVIVAGYTDLMQNFISSNPGLKSRFNRYIEFEDYLPEDLVNILLSYCKKERYILSEEALEYAKEYFKNRYNNRTENYANARDVRNFFEKAIVNLSNRLAQANNYDLSKDELTTIVVDDIKSIEIK